MTRRELFVTALASSEAFRGRFSGCQAILSIIKQLEYLIQIEDSTRHDRDRLKDVIIGILAVREIEVLDLEFAELLYGVQAEVDKMMSE